MASAEPDEKKEQLMEMAAKEHQHPFNVHFKQEVSAVSDQPQLITEMVTQDEIFEETPEERPHNMG